MCHGLWHHPASLVTWGRASIAFPVASSLKWLYRLNGRRLTCPAISSVLPSVWNTARSTGETDFPALSRDYAQDSAAPQRCRFGSGFSDSSQRGLKSATWRRIALQEIIEAMKRLSAASRRLTHAHSEVMREHEKLKAEYEKLRTSRVKADRWLRSITQSQFNQRREF